MTRLNGANSTRRKRKRVTGSDGQLIETYDELGYRPTDQTHMEDRWKYRRNTILMVSFGLPTVPTMQVSISDMDKFYAHMTGKDVMKRPHNRPTMEQMRHVENKVWETVARLIA